METSPLLGDAPSCYEVEARHSSKVGEHVRQHFAKWKTLYICAIYLIATDLPSFMGEATMLRMLELSVCRKYYAIHDPDAVGDDNTYIPEHLCKLPDIQSNLAQMRGLLSFLEAVPGLLLAVPYGILADLYERTLIIGLCLAGFLIRDTWIFICLYFYNTFPLSAVYLAPLTAAIGGGSTVTSPLFFAIVTASTPQELRYSIGFSL